MQSKQFRNTTASKPIKLHANQRRSLIYAIQAVLKSEANGTTFIVPTVYGFDIGFQKPICGIPFYAITDRELSKYSYQHELIRIKQF